jgi:anhydro-N-acetylmuramic acid kinase
VPWVDRMLFAHPTEARVLLNIGGMANLTWVPPRGSTEIVRAFDTGPGNVWLDAAAGLASEGRQVADVDGQLAAAGTVHEPALAALLADPFFAEAPPRSTGREHFSQPRLEAWLTEWSGPLAEWPDRLATLTALTARSIAQALARWIVPLPIAEIVVTGGGARNPALLRAPNSMP